MLTDEQMLNYVLIVQKEGEQSAYEKCGVLYVLPEYTAKSALIDSVTKKMTAAFRRSEHLPWGFGGMHTCVCGATSESQDFALPGGLITNSLCIHYLAMHRDEIPQEQLEKIAVLNCGEAQPSDDEIKAPKNSK